MLRDILVACTQLRFAIDHVDVAQGKAAAENTERAQALAEIDEIDVDESGQGLVSLSMQVKGKRPVSHLIARLSEIDGVVQVGSLSEDTDLE